jgi:myo-inositol-1(or 4)-monophosphatase
LNYQEIINLVKSTCRIILGEENHLEITAKGRANFVTQVDVAVQEYLREQLHKLYPEVLLLAEEQKRIFIQPGKAYWILDPIDGTQNFIRHMGTSAVSLAYYDQGDLQFGVIYNPFLEETFHAAKGQGAYLNGRPIHVTDNNALSNCLVAIGTSPYEREYAASNWPLFAEIFSRCMDIRRGGSASLDLAYVAAGRLDAYVEHNLKPWDMAAGLVLVREAGGSVTNFSHQAVDVNLNSDICATNGLIQEEVLSIIKKHWPTSGC